MSIDCPFTTTLAALQLRASHSQCSGHLRYVSDGPQLLRVAPCHVRGDAPQLLLHHLRVWQPTGGYPSWLKPAVRIHMQHSTVLWAGGRSMSGGQNMQALRTRSKRARLRQQVGQRVVCVPQLVQLGAHAAVHERPRVVGAAGRLAKVDNVAQQAQAWRGQQNKQRSAWFLIPCWSDIRRAGCAPPSWRRPEHAAHACEKCQSVCASSTRGILTCRQV